MAVFDWAESKQVSLEETPRVRRAQFGDGYEQRAADGLNPIQQQWELRFEQVDLSAGQAGADILAFLRARGGVQAFDWTPKWHTAAIRVTCPSWKVSGEDEGLATISARFVQDFAP